MNTSARLKTSLRWYSATLAGLIAGVYRVVGFEMARVPGVAEVEPGPAVPLVLAGMAFAGLAAALLLDAQSLGGCCRGTADAAHDHRLTSSSLRVATLRSSRRG